MADSLLSGAPTGNGMMLRGVTNYLLDMLFRFVREFLRSSTLVCKPCRCAHATAHATALDTCLLYCLL